MAISIVQNPPRTTRLPQDKYVDAVRYLPAVSSLQKLAVTAFHDADNGIPSLELLSLDPLDPAPTRVLWTPPARVSSLKTTSSFTVASTISGSLHVLSITGFEDMVSRPKVSVAGMEFHLGEIQCVDLMDGGSDCLSVGVDGRINLVGIDNERYRRVFDGKGLVCYNAVRWASPSEFVTGGYGCGIQWWDLRHSGGLVAQFKGIWNRQGTTSGHIHSVDIHPSRKHSCLAGGSSGTVFIWDLRSQQQPILLAGFALQGGGSVMSESEIWEVRNDTHIHASNSSSASSSSSILPAMACSEDGILAVIAQPGEGGPVELLTVPCSINSFDVHPQNPSEVICSLEWEEIAVLSRF